MKGETTDKCKVIFVIPPRKPIWRGWLKPKEAREYAAGIDVRTWRNWKEKGLKTVQIKGLLLTRPEWIDDFILSEGEGALKEHVTDFLARGKK